MREEPDHRIEHHLWDRPERAGKNSQDLSPLVIVHFSKVGKRDSADRVSPEPHDNSPNKQQGSDAIVPSEGKNNRPDSTGKQGQHNDNFAPYFIRKYWEEDKPDNGAEVLGGEDAISEVTILAVEIQFSGEGVGILDGAGGDDGAGFGFGDFCFAPACECWGDEEVGGAED